MSAEESESDDPRLLEALKEYAAGVESGRRVNRQELIARHPDIATELSACLQGLAFLNGAAAELGVGQNRAERADHAGVEAGQPLGDFRLIREIGRGGMGIVYEAEQLSLGRRVAVKVLPMAAAMDPRHLQRFRNEAQAAAQLHHTNIVPVYAVGSERSVHFYAMQLIDGVSLADVIRELRAAAKDKRETEQPTETFRPFDRTEIIRGISAEVGLKRESSSTVSQRTEFPAAPVPRVLKHSSAAPLSLPTLHSNKRAAYFRAVAKLGLQAAEALAYAHRAGVVHRDIKPANLLLDTRGSIWITDFGLAQVYADSGLTQTGDMLGTLRYMSPEQASGRAVVLDERTDIYSLGVTLYELLTLERALPGESRHELLHQIDTNDPKPARAIDRLIPRELEIVLIKSMAKDPADRYRNANALAEDLRRFLDDEPILARPPTLLDKGIKWVRRHRPLAFAAVLVLVLTSVGLSISTFLIAQAQSNTQDALANERINARVAHEQRIRADRNARQAREAVNYYTRVATDELPREPQLMEVRRELLEASLAYYQDFLNQGKDDPEMATEVAAARYQVAAVLRELTGVDDLMRLFFAQALLSETSVQKELQLTANQVQIAGDLIEQRKAPKMTDLDRMTLEQRQANLTRETELARTQIAGLLSPAQLTRLKQIVRQKMGVSVFRDAEVIEALEMTSVQKTTANKALTNLRAEYFRRRNVDRMQGPPPDDKPDETSQLLMREDRSSENVARIAEFTQRSQDAVAEIVKTFSPAQAKAWHWLLGAPFTGDIHINVPDFGPPSRPRS